jgi:energy-coupling factor transporter ATP-binding protein EcfA2
MAAALRSVFRRQYDEVRAVDGVSFRIEQGARVGFLGPNGAGKTTTLKMLSGLLHPTRGRVEVLGYVPRAENAAVAWALDRGEPLQARISRLPTEAGAGMLSDAERETLTRANIRSIRPGNGLAPAHFDEVMGRKAARDLVRGEPLAWDMVA